MYIHHILTYIDALKSFSDLTSNDKKLVETLETHFNQRAKDEVLNSEDIERLLACYKTRWLQIIDLEQDYTLNTQGSNVKWIELAKELATNCNKSYILILMPICTNRRIFTYINALKSFTDITSNDKKHLETLETHFSQRAKDEPLNSEDMERLLACYKTRWLQIRDDLEQDYTLNPQGANVKWIELAKELTWYCNKNYIQILMPTCTNPKDLNTLSLLTETTRLENFYMGHDGNTLYRKRGLADLLIANRYKLATCRELSTKKLSALTVDELYRLSVCKQPQGAFKVEEEQFFSFWDFLNKKVFTRLQAKGEMPQELLPQLVQLVDHYFKLKESNADFQLFKDAADHFFAALYEQDLDNINYFYGAKVSYMGQEHYLLELLIEIYKAKSYTLDEYLRQLRTMLVQHSPALKTSSKDTNNKSVHLDEKSSLVADDINSCLSLIVSLFTTGMLPLKQSNISFWDKSNGVLQVAANIYKHLQPYIDTNNTTELVKAYKHVM